MTGKEIKESYSEAPGAQDAHGVGLRLSAWLGNRMSGYGFMLLIAVVSGIATGLLAVLFKHMISGFSSLFIPRIKEGEINWWIVAVPVAGILFTGILTRYAVRTNLTHVVAQLKQRLDAGRFRMRRNLVFSAIAGGSVTLGMGGTSGAEGPIAVTGAAVANNLGQWLGLDSKRLRCLMGCGAAAGISAIFSAPIGGVMFSLELLRVRLDTQSVITVITGALSAYVTVLCCTGFGPDIDFIPSAGFEWDTLLWIIPLGLFCGFYSRYYRYINRRLDNFFKGVSNPWAKNLTGGLSLGLILLLFPSLFSTGYPVITEIVNGHPEAMAKGSVLSVLTEGQWLLAAAATGILLVKCWGVAATNSSGGVGGDFAPTLFSGSVCGYLFATLANTLCASGLPAGLFAYYGMAGVMAGAIQAPLMSIFIVMEMGAAYPYALPICITAAVSYAVSRFPYGRPN